MAVRVNPDWPFQVFRSRWVAEIEESVRLTGMPTARSAAEIEELIFLRAWTKDKYLALVTQLIIGIKEYNKNETPQGMSGGHGDINAGAPPGTGDNQGDIEHLLNVLQNLRL